MPLFLCLKGCFFLDLCQPGCKTWPLNQVAQEMHMHIIHEQGLIFPKGLRSERTFTIFHCLSVQLSPSHLPPIPAPVLLLPFSYMISCLLPVNLSLCRALEHPLFYPPKPSERLNRTKVRALAPPPLRVLVLSSGTVLFSTAIMSIFKVVPGERVIE